MAKKLQPRASSVSLTLRKAGWFPRASRDREGLQVFKRYDGAITVLCDWDAAGISRRQSLMAEEVLTEAGYLTERSSDSTFAVVPHPE